MTRYVAVAEAKAGLSGLLRSVEERGERVVIERRGRPVAVLERYDEGAEREKHRHWAADLEGIAAGIGGFDRIMKEVVRSRKDARPRPVRLED